MKNKYLNETKMVGGVGKTPPSDRISDESAFSMCMDWFSCSFDFYQISYQYAPSFSWQAKEYLAGKERLEKLYELLTFPDERERTYFNDSKRGYTSYVCAGEFIKIYFNGPVNKNSLNTNLLEMSGQACKDFVERGGNFIDLFNFLLKKGGNFTRADAALDVFTDVYFDMDKLTNYVKKHSYLSPMSAWEIVSSGNRSVETDTGKTIYIGSKKSSNTLVCIYDKLLEQFSKGIQTFKKTWIRLEMRFKHERAEWFVSNFLHHSQGDNDYSFIIKALYTVLDFRDKTNSSNRSDWKKCTWWTDFLGNVEKVDFGSKIKTEPTIKRKKDWLVRSVSKSLNQFYYVEPGNYIPYLLFLVNKRNIDFNEMDLKMINDYRQKRKLPLITMEDVKKMQNDLENILLSLGDFNERNSNE